MTAAFWLVEWPVAIPSLGTNTRVVCTTWAEAIEYRTQIIAAGQQPSMSRTAEPPTEQVSR